MVFSKFNRLTVPRILAVALIPLVIGHLVSQPDSLSWIIGLGLLELVLILELIRFINKSNRQISFFIQAIRNDDTTLRFPANTRNPVLNDLHQSLNTLNRVLQDTRVKGQIRERYFSEILQHIGTGVMVCNEKGFVLEVNPAALELFGIQTLTHLSQLDRVDPRFKTDLLALSSQQKQVITLRKPSDQVQIITRFSTIKLKDEEVKLITFQDIRGELERKELDSWVKLIRVLSHEIMNSLTPVTSITQSLQGIWRKKISNEAWLASDEAVDNTIRGLEVIGEQGEGLIRFVQSYRVLTRVPVPQLAPVGLFSLLDRLSILVSPMKSDFAVDIRFHYPKSDAQVLMDEQMIIQVVINLVKNAAEALQTTTDPVISIACQTADKDLTILTVTDNGPGIPEELLEEIFVPFFTTKSNGTGIGLSHSRQILRAHGGSISCSSEPGRTVFKILW